MSQNIIEVGKTKAEMPEHRYDSVDGGASLFNIMFNLYTRFSDDSIRCRTKSFSIASGSSVVFEHNIGQNSSEIEIKMFISGVEYSEDLFSSEFSIVHNDTNTITCTNISGGNRTGWMVVSGLLHNRADQLRLRERSASPSSVADGEVAIFSQNDNIYAKNSFGTVMGLTDSTVIQAPAGVMLAYAGASLPDGFLWADGSQVSRATFARLFAAIGTTHGAGDGSFTFNLPDYRDVNYIIKF